MSELGNKRADRVGQLLQQELGQLLVQGVNDPRVGFVTVTEVRLSDDLRSARAYVSIYGTDEQREETLEGLRNSAGFLRRELGRRVHMRHVPTLTFAHDTTLDEAQRLDALLAAASEPSAPAGETDTSDVVPVDVVPVQTNRSALAKSAAALAESAPKKPAPRRRRPRRGGRTRKRKS